MAFECLAGRKPYVADSPVATAIAHLREPVPELPDSVPADLARVVRRALSKAPEERYTDGTTFARALRNPGGEQAATVVAPVVAPAAASQGTQVMPAVAPMTAPTPAPPERRRTSPAVPWPLLVGIAAVLVAVLAAVWLGTRDTEDTSGSTGVDPSPSQSRSPSQEPTETPTETPAETPTESPTETQPEPETATVEVDPAAYVGGRVKDVEKELSQLGLVPELVELENPGDVESDTVVEVSPSGTLEEGDTVTISYYGKAPKGNGKGSEG